MLKYGVIGPGRIGQIHADIFDRLGCKLIAVLSRNSTSAQNFLMAKKRKHVLPCRNINDLLSCGVDFIVLSSPTESHFDYLTLLCHSRIPVYCEKPLFWSPRISDTGILQRLESLRTNGEWLLYLNLPFRYVGVVASKIKEINTNSLKTFSFKYHTNGLHRYKNIGVDLLPHGMSMLHSLFGSKAIGQVSREISSQINNYTFHYGDIRCEFSLKESANSHKLLEFQFDDFMIRRRHSGAGSNYKPHLANEKGICLTDYIDPFVANASEFLELLKTRNMDVSEFHYKLAFHNMTSMGRCLCN